MISKRLGFFRKFGLELFGPLARLLIKLGISANMATVFSFLMGALAIFFLFNNSVLYFIFVILHLISDILDGEIARISNQATKLGTWFDHFVDRSIVVLLFIKCYFYLGSMGVPEGLFWSVVVFYIIQHLIYIVSNRKIILIYSRTIALIAFMFTVYTEIFVILFVVNAFGIVLQIINFLVNLSNKKRKNK